MVQLGQEVYLALGSNLGDREKQLQEARKRLAAEVQIEQESPVYETDPWGYTDQDNFLNQVVYGLTELEPLELLMFLKNIERNMGRQDGIRYGPRVIDLDILLYSNLNAATDDLEIPHPRMTERAFVMIPLLDIAPDLIIPGVDRTVRDITGGLDRSGVNKYEPQGEQDR